MSIQTEITRLNTAKANILTSISNKGVDTSSVNTLNDIPPLIDSITGGTGSGGDYNIAVTIDGNTQELAITDAEGSGGGNTDIEDSLVEGSITQYTNDRITTIRSYGLAYCTKLTSIDLPNVTSISPYAFRADSVLTSINIPKVTLINTCCFQDCTILNDLDFTNITQIGSSAFQSCKGLTKLILRSETMVTLKNTNVFSGTPIAGGTGFVYVPDNLKTQYQQATNWSTYASQIKGLSEL